MKLRTEWEAGGDRSVFLSEDVRVPAALTATFGFERDHTVRLELAMEQGRPVCERIEVIRHPDRRPLDGEELRRLPLPRYVKLAYSGAALVRTQANEDGSVSWEPADDEQSSRVADLLTRSRRRNAITDSLLRDVAEVYRAADARPTTAVMEAFSVSHSTAARYVRLARERNYLPSTRPGKASR